MTEEAQQPSREDLESRILIMVTVLDEDKLEDFVLPHVLVWSGDKIDDLTQRVLSQVQEHLGDAFSAEKYEHYRIYVENKPLVWCQKFFKGKWFPSVTFEKNEGVANATKILNDLDGQKRVATLEELQEIFMGLDDNNDGKLDKVEVGLLVNEILKRLGASENAVEELTTMLFEIGDINQDGHIDLEEFQDRGEEILGVLLAHAKSQ